MKLFNDWEEPVKVVDYISKYFNRGLLIFSLLMYSSIYIPPEKIWLAGFGAFMIPVVVVVNIIIFLFFALKKDRRVFYPVISIILAYSFIHSTFVVNMPNNRQHDLSVMSYNVRVFNAYEKSGNNELRKSKVMLNWLEHDTTDIYCFQEFYNLNDSPIYNTKNRLGKKKGYYSYNKSSLVNTYGAEFGTAIFSKYPIIKEGYVVFSTPSKNSAMYVDIVKHKDTLRIYNVHLQSMHLKQDQLENSETINQNKWSIMNSLKNGVIIRSKQVKEVLQHAKDSCNTQVIICGDLNDLPYSYTYHKLLDKYQNAHEEAGFGFGFTFNSSKLFFLRIDNQFYSQGLFAVDNTVLRNINYTDHFPIKTKYKIW